MKKLKKFLATPAVTIAAFVLAVGLLAFSGIGGARAALTYYSENYISTMQLHQIQVQLVENGTPVAFGEGEVGARADAARGALLQHMMIGTAVEGDNEPLKLGVAYTEALAVRNPEYTGNDDVENIDEYVRVTVRTYWESKHESEDAEGNTVVTYEKDPELNAKFIKLDIVTGQNGWVKDENASTDERTVLYYTRPLPVDETTDPFSSTLTIDPKAAVTVTQTENGNVTTTTYLYDDARFNLEVTVDAVQTHNAAAAIWSAWGRRVEIAADGTLTLVDNA